MFSCFAKLRPLLGQQIPQWRMFFSWSAPRNSSDPLRILFCGSDEFSCASLKALHNEHDQSKKLIESLDVMVLPPKRMGRGFKTLREVPCKLLAEDLGLRIHQRETFTRWNLPEGINLVIAVSFGLFVPPRILKSAKYGGLNVHPSLLPDLRGPAPIHHAILSGYEYTGISLQTLDERAFDHGIVLSQTPRPGISMPPGCTVQELTNLLAPIGAQMLVQGLRNGLHVPPRQNKGWKAEEISEEQVIHAHKVTKADGRVKWTEWTADEIVRRIRVFGSVWTHAVNKKGETKRLIFQDAEIISSNSVWEDEAKVQFVEGTGGRIFESRVMDQGDGSCAIRALGNSVIHVRKIKEEGKPERTAMLALKGYIADDQI
ncbi:methionyl-tRNA formyltransferase [Fusarium beomiforme]|uniref:methionyl-tRNA formyltransferase n=1 Tax=Fusarium beomiforme TaxID=44412 RepID=A0A9P5AUW4_9HYPO|nr:methionyl-tRNA formyltransferase [Fusarium beomiforme]